MESPKSHICISQLANTRTLCVTAAQPPPCTNLTQLIFLHSLIHAESAHILYLLHTDEERRAGRERHYGLLYLSFFMYDIIFNVSGWLIQGSNTRKKAYGRIPWSTMVLSMTSPSFCIRNKFRFKWSVRTVRAERNNMHLSSTPACALLPHLASLTKHELKEN